jgi:hypothetical protein
MPARRTRLAGPHRRARRPKAFAVGNQTHDTGEPVTQADPSSNIVQTTIFRWCECEDRPGSQKSPPHRDGLFVRRAGVYS